MFGWAITFLVIAIIAGVFGFAGIASTATLIAKVLFVIGLVALLGLLVMGRNLNPLQGTRHAGRHVPDLKAYLPGCRQKKTKYPIQNR